MGHSPHVNDVAGSASMLVLILDNVAVSSIELTKGFWVHWNFIGPLDPPNLQKGRSTNRLDGIQKNIRTSATDENAITDRSL